VGRLGSISVGDMAGEGRRVYCRGLFQALVAMINQIDHAIVEEIYLLSKPTIRV